MWSRWAWVLQDTLGIAFCLYMLKTVRLPTFKVLKRQHVIKRVTEVEISSFSSAAGLHFTPDGALRLRRLFRVHHAVLHKGSFTDATSLSALSCRSCHAERLSLRRAARALWWRWRQALPTQPRTKRWRFFFLTLYIYINKKLIPSLILLVWSAASDGAQGAALELLPPRPMRSALLPAGFWRHPGARWLNDTRKSNCRRKTDWQHYIYIYFFFITFNFWCELSHWLWIRIAYNDPNQYEIQSQCETAIIGFQLWNYSYSCRLKNTLPIFF